MSGAEVTSELLSLHETEAVFRGVEEGRESMLRIYPPQPNKLWAVFDIVRYLKYEAAQDGFGDKQQQQFSVLADTVLTTGVQLTHLRAGKRVLLSWNHNYVTSREVVDDLERVNKFPERVITKLELLES